MKYLEAVDKIRGIEANYDLMSIKCNGISIWPLVRINLIDRLDERDLTMKDNGRKAAAIVLKTLFKHNPFAAFRRHKIWLFAGYERRKVIGGENVLRVSGAVVEAEPDTLVIEKPSHLQLNRCDAISPERHIISESWLLLLIHLFASILKITKQKIENEELLKAILEELNVDFDYKGSLRLLFAQKKVMSFLLHVLPNPKKVIIECPYTIMGYVWAFHNKDIHVVEMQHGVLNREHYAYNSYYHSNELYPDELWCFGDDEYQYLISNECHYCNIIKKTGLYFLELTNRFFVEDIFKEYRKNYDKIVLVAGQRGYEQIMASFTEEIAKEDKNSLFVYVPRTTEETVKITAENVIYTPRVNIYEYMKWCDIHLTISSTTAIECQYYKKPTIFYDYEKLGSTYYQNVLKEVNGIRYVMSPQEYLKALQDLNQSEIHYKECFTSNTVKIIQNLLN